MRSVNTDWHARNVRSARDSAMLETLTVRDRASRDLARKLGCKPHRTSAEASDFLAKTIGAERP